MPHINGFYMSAGNCRLLRTIVEAQRAGEIPDGCGYSPDGREERERLDELESIGMVKVYRVPTRPDAALPTLRGADFVDDMLAEEAKAEEERRKTNRHDWQLTIAGIFGGLFSGALGAWVIKAVIAGLQAIG